MIEVDRSMLLAAAQDCGYPAVELGELTFQGEEAWRAATARATARERRTLLARLSPFLLTVGEGARRIAAWPDVAPSNHPIARLDRRGLRHAVAYYGDVAVLDVVVDALLIAPPIVRVAVVEEARILGDGWSSRAWTSGARFASPDDGAPRHRLVVLCGAGRDAEIVRRAFLHECGHLWSGAPADPELDWCPLAAGVEAVSALAHEEGWPALARRPARECLADTLAAAWECAAEA